MILKMKNSASDLKKKNSKTRDFNLSSCRETEFELANVKRGDTFPFSMKNKWRIDIKIFLKIKKNLETKGHLTSL